MSHQDLIERLLVLPEAMQRAEADLLDADERRRKAEFDLEVREDELLLSGSIDGKNAEQRAAQVRQATAPERLEAERRRAESKRCEASLNLLRTQHSSLKAIARLLGGE